MTPAHEAHTAPPEAPAAVGPTVRFKLQLVVGDGHVHNETLELGNLTKRCKHIEQVGLSLDSACGGCGRALGVMGHHRVAIRSLFGRIDVPSPRLPRCPCSGERASFSPLAELLPQRNTPELLYLEAKWASAMSYEHAARLLADCLPIDEKINASNVRNHVMRLTERLEDELGDEKVFFGEDCPTTSPRCPQPASRSPSASTAATSAGGTTGRRTPRFSSVSTDGPAKRFGMVQQFDTNPRRRLFDTLVSQGLQANQLVRFLSDGERALQRACGLRARRAGLGAGGPWR